MTLNPPWINVLQKDAVTLHCQGPHSPEDPKTHWFHNGRSLDTQGQPSLNFRASSNSSGNYSCQTDRSLLSDQVQLTVVSGQCSPVVHPSILLPIALWGPAPQRGAGERNTRLEKGIP